MSQKNLISFCNVKIVLNRVQNPEFLFTYADAKEGDKYRFKIKKAVLRVRKNKIRDSYSQFWEQKLNAGGLIRYYFKDCRCFTRTFAGIPSELIEDNLCHSILPTKLFFGFVESAGFKGDKTKDPFQFTNVSNTITEVANFVNGRPFPLPALRGDFATCNTYEMYYHLLESVQGVHSPDPPMIKKTDFDAGQSTIFGYNLSPDQFESSDLRSLFNQPANIRLQVKFSTGDTTKSLTLVCYYEMHASLSINKTRQVVYQAQ